MAKGALYWRHKDEKTGNWKYVKVRTQEHMQGIQNWIHNIEHILNNVYQEEE